MDPESQFTGLMLQQSTLFFSSSPSLCSQVAVIFCQTLSFMSRYNVTIFIFRWWAVRAFLMDKLNGKLKIKNYYFNFFFFFHPSNKKPNKILKCLFFFTDVIFIHLFKELKPTK